MDNSNDNINDETPKRKRFYWKLYLGIIIGLIAYVYYQYEYAGVDFGLFKKESIEKDSTRLGNQMINDSSLIEGDSLMTDTLINTAIDSTITTKIDSIKEKESIFKFNDYSKLKLTSNQSGSVSNESSGFLNNKNLIKSSGSSSPVNKDPFQKLVLDKGNDLLQKQLNKDMVNFKSLLKVSSIVANEILSNGSAGKLDYSILNSFIDNETIKLISVVDNDGQLLYSSDTKFTPSPSDNSYNQISTLSNESNVKTIIPIYQIYGKLGYLVIVTQ